MKIVKKIGMLMGAALFISSVGMAYAADASATTALPPIKVAIVNVQSVLQQSSRVAALSKKLEGEFKGRQDKINDEQKGLQDKLEKFKKEAPTMSQKDRDEMQKKMSTERSELVKKVVAYQADLQKEQSKVMQGILDDLNKIVTGIAKDQKYALVLDSQAVIFALDGNDITKEVSKKFNK